MNLGCNFLKNQIKGGMSYRLWWLETMITGTLLGIFSNPVILYVVPKICVERTKNQLSTATLIR